MSDLYIDYWGVYSAEIDRFVELGDTAEAIVCAEQLIRHYPGTVVAWQRYAELLLKDGRLDEADKAFERAMTLDPHHPALMLSWAARLRDRNDLDRACAVLAPMLLKRPGSEAAACLACELLAAQGKRDDARKLISGFV